MNSILNLSVYLLIVCVSFGCTNSATTSKNLVATYDLATVVEAVQYAIDLASTNNAWAATEIEQKHWKDLCDKAQEKSSESYINLLNRADLMCRAKCSKNHCSPSDISFCNSFISAENKNSICKLNSFSGLNLWCNAADTYLADKKDEARVCTALSSLVLPKLQKATLVLKVDESTKSGADVNILVVKFGGSKKVGVANTVTIEMTPRVRDPKYLPSHDPNSDRAPRIPSKNAVQLAGKLADLIIDAVTSGTLELEKDGKGIVPPLSLSNFKIELALSVNKQGSLSIGKTWDSLPYGINVGGEKDSNIANTLVIEYSKKE